MVTCCLWGGTVYHDRNVCDGGGVCLPHDGQRSKIQKGQGIPFKDIVPTAYFFP